MHIYFFFFSSRRRHTRCSRDWSSDVCSSDLWNQNHSATSGTRLERSSKRANRTTSTTKPRRRRRRGGRRATRSAAVMKGRLTQKRGCGQGERQRSTLLAQGIDAPLDAPIGNEPDERDQ